MRYDDSINHCVNYFINSLNNGCIFKEIIPNIKVFNKKGFGDRKRNVESIKLSFVDDIIVSEFVDDISKYIISNVESKLNSDESVKYEFVKQTNFYLEEFDNNEFSQFINDNYLVSMVLNNKVILKSVLFRLFVYGDSMLAKGSDVDVNMIIDVSNFVLVTLEICVKSKNDNC